MGRLRQYSHSLGSKPPKIVIFTKTDPYTTLEETPIPKQPEFSKYLPLEEWFRTQSPAEKQIEMTFDQVEAILGTPLPASATKLKTWWTNVPPKIQSHRTAWLNNDWVVAEFDQESRRVRFVRA